MELYQEEFVKLLADSGALFFADGLKLKDGRPTPYFVNTGVFGEKASLRWGLAQAYAGMIARRVNDQKTPVDLVVGPSYKGSMIATDATLALLLDYDMDLGCSYDRKEAKDHGEGSSRKEMFVGAKFYDGVNIYVVDDVATSMGTKKDLLSKIRSESEVGLFGFNVSGIGIAFDRQQVNLEGRNAVRDFTEETNIPVDSIVGSREAMKFLINSKYPVNVNGDKRPLKHSEFEKFTAYMENYGSR